jgi:hypothetical protein
MLRSSFDLQKLRSAFAIALMGLCTVMDEGKADEIDVVKDILTKISAGERAALPQPDRYNPASWGLPDYARTPYLCKGDITFADYLERLFAQKARGKFNFHHVAAGFTSVALDLKDENTLDVLELSSSQIDTLRAIIRMRIEFFQSSQTFGTWLLLATGIPGLAAAAESWGIFLVGGAITGANVSFSDSTMTPLQTLADQMLADVHAYRIVLTPKSADGMDYVRYIFAVKPAGQRLFVLRNCVYARH